MRFVPLFVLKFQMAARAERDAAAGQSRCEKRLIELLGERPLKLEAPARRLDLRGALLVL